MTNEYVTDEEYKVFKIEPHSGHRLIWDDKNSSYYQYLACECKELRFWVRRLDDGTYFGRHRTEYSTHIRNLSIPEDTMTTVGTVTKPRVIWKLNVFTIRHPDALLYAQSERWKRWIGNTNEYGSNYIWVLGAEKNRQNSTLGIYKSRHDAVVKALGVLDKQEQLGFIVERLIELEPQIEANSFSITDMLSDFLTKVDTSLNSGAEFRLLQQMDEMLAMVPVIQSKAEQLRKKLDLTLPT